MPTVGKRFWWIRTCHDCNSETKANRPVQDKPLAADYRHAKCPICLSEALDYGKEEVDYDADQD